ncbi:MAG TPA: MBL fold metallo-hydrolase [Stackebrandtia sp.]|jgi:L-ascorbate metabolism protein UlaG (beta-lactamase superfamily)|uniref:MBL fold metallo-hydrolase n=1 Tax=Stackebrandtia sp. TaxID=2023065 RepID=UPI002D2A8818|nr:MBL fold metallo-hydrolase [Stackebrandtia sp.]HZE39578.1 MBL fold metallo-hydrolase [Stackebrandtia sp.]
MRLTKYTHACVRLEADGHVLVIDPGEWSEAASLDGADAVVITHEHGDHVDPDKLTSAVEANPNLAVFAPADVAEQASGLGIAVTTIGVGESFDAAGFRISAQGGEHAKIMKGRPTCANLAYLVETAGGTVYYPGDSLHRPETAVDTLLVPTCAPWLKLVEAVEFVQDVAPRRAISTHDAMLTDKGELVVDSWFVEYGGTEYLRMAPGESLDLNG